MIAPSLADSVGASLLVVAVQWIEGVAPETIATSIALTPDRILRIKTVLARTGLSRSTMYRKMDSGTFPRNIKISTRCAGWRESSVNAWLKNPLFYRSDEHRGD